MITILLFFLVLSVLVVFHEFGHYLMARFFGVKAEEFGIGFPPRAVGVVRDAGGWKRVSGKDEQSYKNTIWSLNWLPLGGFVRLKGEQDTKNLDQDAFAAKSAFARAWILVAGVLMNWLLAILIFSAGYAIGVPTDLEGLPAGSNVRDQRVEITQVLEGSPAAQAGLQTGDRLIWINGTAISSAENARTTLANASQAQGEVPLQIRRGDNLIEVRATPTYIASIQHAGIGVGLADVGIVRLPIHQAIAQGVVTTYAFTKLILSGFWQIIHDLLVLHRSEAQLSGPVGIAVMTGKIAAQGLWPLLQFAALLSINLAVVNLLPIPALDGGRLLFVMIEVLRRGRKNFAWEGRAHQIGFVLLLSLIAFITIKDIGTYGAPLWNGLKHIIGF